MTIRPLARWPDYFPRVRRRVLVPRNVGPKRALSLDEQLEVQRTLREAAVAGRRTSTARDLARRYGVSVRTIYRYAEAAAPTDAKVLRVRIARWADDRGIRVTHDDVTTLIAVLGRKS